SLGAVAVASAVAYLTETVWPLAADRLTVKIAPFVPLFPSVTLALLRERLGNGSSSLIVPTPCAFTIVALTGLVRLTKKFSLASFRVSPTTGTVIVLVVWLGLK